MYVSHVDTQKYIGALGGCPPYNISMRHFSIQEHFFTYKPLQVASHPPIRIVISYILLRAHAFSFMGSSIVSTHKLLSQAYKSIFSINS